MAAWHTKQRTRIFDEFPDQRKSYQEYLQHSQFDAYWQQAGYYPAARFARRQGVTRMQQCGRGCAPAAPGHEDGTGSARRMERRL